MIAYIISLSLLTAAVILVRAIFRKNVPARLIYALWLVVLIRMAVPVTLFNVDVKLPDFGLSENAPVTEQTDKTVVNQQSGPGTIVMPVPENTPQTVVPDDGHTMHNGKEPVSQQSFPEADDTISKTANPVSWKHILNIIWASGAAVLAVWFGVSGISFYRKLFKDRKKYGLYKNVKVYISSSAGVPCVAGIVPSIYVTPETADRNSGPYILKHEYVHIRHGDHIWSIIRSIVLTIFWWNPIIWAAAFFSKRDSELACDEAVSFKMNDKERLKYANILLATAPQERNYATGLGSPPLKERILMLTKKPRNRFICFALVLLLVLSAAGCSFVAVGRENDENVPGNTVNDDSGSTGNQETDSQETEPDETKPQETEPEETDSEEIIPSEIHDTEPGDSDTKVETETQPAETTDMSGENQPEEWLTTYYEAGDKLTVSFVAGKSNGTITTFLASDPSDVNFDVFWTVNTKPSSEIIIAFYTESFREGGKSLREKCYDAFDSLPVPSATETSDLSNSQEVRQAVSKVLNVTLNGAMVTGDLYRTQGNGHVDYVFGFDDGYVISPGDEIVITIDSVQPAETTDMSGENKPEEWLTTYYEAGDKLTVSFVAGKSNDTITTFLARDPSDANFDVFWTVNTKPSSEIIIAFYPESFREGQKSLREKCYDAFASLPVPSATETSDLSNSQEVRQAVGKVLSVTLNGAVVTGDLYRTQGNGHVDYVFGFDGGYVVTPGDEIVITIDSAQPVDTAVNYNLAREYQDITYNIAYLGKLYYGETPIISEEKLNDWVNNVFLKKTIDEQNALPTMVQAIRELGITREQLTALNEERKTLGDDMILTDEYISALFLDENEMKQKLMNPTAYMFDGVIYTWEKIVRMTSEELEAIGLDEKTLEEYVDRVIEYYTENKILDEKYLRAFWKNY